MMRVKSKSLLTTFSVNRFPLSLRLRFSGWVKLRSTNQREAMQSLLLGIVASSPALGKAGSAVPGAVKVCKLSIPGMSRSLLCHFAAWCKLHRCTQREALAQALILLFKGYGEEQTT